MIYFNIGSVSLCANVDPESEPRPGSRMPLSFNMNRMHLFDPAGGRSFRPEGVGDEQLKVFWPA